MNQALNHPHIGESTVFLTLLEPQSRFGDKPFKLQVICPQNGTAVLLIEARTPVPPAPPPARPALPFLGLLSRSGNKPL